MDLTAVPSEGAHAVSRLRSIVVMLQADKSELERKVASLELDKQSAKEITRGASTKFAKEAEKQRQIAESVAKERDAVIEEFNAYKKKTTARLGMSSEEGKQLKSKLAAKESESEQLQVECSNLRLAQDKLAKECAALKTALQQADSYATSVLKDRDSALSELSSLRSQFSVELESTRAELSSTVQELQAALATANSSNVQAGQLLQQFMDEVDRLRTALSEQASSSLQRLHSERHDSKRDLALMRMADVLSRAHRGTLGAALARWKEETLRSALGSRGSISDTADLLPGKSVASGLAGPKLLLQQVADQGNKLQEETMRRTAMEKEIDSLKVALAGALQRADSTSSQFEQLQADCLLAKRSANAEAARGAVAYKQLQQVRSLLVSATQAQASALRKMLSSKPALANVLPASAASSPSTTGLPSAVKGSSGQGQRRAGMLESPTSPASVTSREHGDRFALSEPVDDEEAPSLGLGSAVGRTAAGSRYLHAGFNLAAAGPSLAAARAAIDSAEDLSLAAADSKQDDATGLDVADAGDVPLSSATPLGRGTGLRELANNDPWIESIRLLAHVHAEKTRVRFFATELVSAREQIEALETTVSSLHTSLSASQNCERALGAALEQEEVRRLAVQAVLKRLRLLNRADVDAAAAMVAGTANAHWAALSKATDASSNALAVDLQSLLTDKISSPPAESKHELLKRLQSRSRAYIGFTRELLQDLSVGVSNSLSSTSSLASLANSTLNLKDLGAVNGHTTGAVGHDNNARFVSALSVRVQGLEAQLLEADGRESQLRAEKSKLGKELEAARLQVSHAAVQLAQTREGAAGESSRLAGEIALLKTRDEQSTSAVNNLRTLLKEQQQSAEGLARAQSAAAEAQATAARLAAELHSARELLSLEKEGKERVSVQLDAIRAALLQARSKELHAQENNSSRESVLARELDDCKNKLTELERQLELAAEEMLESRRMATSAQEEVAVAKAGKDEAAAQLGRALDRLEHALGERDGLARAREQDREAHGREVGSLLAALRAAEDRTNASISAAQADAEVERQVLREQLCTDYDRKIASLESSKAELSARVASSDADIAEAQAAARTAESKAEAALAKQRELESLVQELSSALQSGELRAEAMQISLDEARSQLNQAQVDLQSARAAAAAATAVASTPRRGGRESQLEAEVQLVEERAVRLQESIDQLQEQLQQKSEEHAQGQKDLQRALSLLSQLQGALETRNTLLRQIESTLAEREAAIEQRDRTIQQLQQDLVATSSTASSSSGSSSAAAIFTTSDTAQLRVTADGLQADLHVAQDAVEEARARAATHAAEMVDLSQRLDAVTRDHEEAVRAARHVKAELVAHVSRVQSMIAVLLRPLQQAVQETGAPHAVVHLQWPSVHELSSLMTSLTSAQASEGESASSADLQGQLQVLLQRTAAQARFQPPTVLGAVSSYGPGDLQSVADKESRLAAAVELARTAEEDCAETQERLLALTEVLAKTQAECLRLSEDSVDRTRQYNDLLARYRRLDAQFAQRQAAASAAPMEQGAAQMPITTSRPSASGSSSTPSRAYTPVGTVEESPSAEWRPVGLLAPAVGPSMPVEQQEQDGAQPGSTSQASSGQQQQPPKDGSTLSGMDSSTLSLLEGHLGRLAHDPQFAPLAEAIRAAIASGDPAANAAAMQALASVLSRSSAGSGGSTPSSSRVTRSHLPEPSLPTIEEGSEMGSVSDGASLRSSPAASSIGMQSPPASGVRQPSLLSPPTSSSSASAAMGRQADAGAGAGQLLTHLSPVEEKPTVTRPGANAPAAQLTFSPLARLDAVLRGNPSAAPPSASKPPSTGSAPTTSTASGGSTERRVTFAALDTAKAAAKPASIAPPPEQVRRPAPAIPVPPASASALPAPSAINASAGKGAGAMPQADTVQAATDRVGTQATGGSALLARLLAEGNTASGAPSALPGASTGTGTGTGTPSRPLPGGKTLQTMGLDDLLGVLGKK